MTPYRAKVRRFNARVLDVSEFLELDCGVIPGDSGGAVLNDEREAVGLISGGWNRGRYEEIPYGMSFYPLHIYMSPVYGPAIAVRLDVIEDLIEGL